jgi:hypothetical protein
VRYAVAILFVIWAHPNFAEEQKTVSEDENVAITSIGNIPDE